MSISIIPNGFYAQGRSIRVTGNKRSQPAVSGVSVTVVVQQAADDAGNSTQGKATLKGVNITTGITDWEVVVPSNLSAGTFEPGRAMVYIITTADSAGNQIDERAGRWEVEGGSTSEFPGRGTAFTVSE